MIPIYKPYLPKESLQYAHDAIDSTWISSHGKYLSLVKDKLKDITGSKYIVLTNNGTSATHLLAMVLKFKYPNIKHLIVPSNVYVAAWNMFLSNPKYDFIPIDSDIDTWNISLEELENKYELHFDNVGFLAVHNIGNIINIPELKKKYPKWVFVEDNCEGFLGTYNGENSGTASLAHSISFFGNKTITTGEGGLFGTNDEEIFEYANKAKAQFNTKEKFVFENLGYNYRMTNVQAAILYGQLEILPEIIERKREVFELYQKEFKNVEEISIQTIKEGTTHSNWMFGIRINNSSKEDVDKLKLHLYQNDIDTRPMFPPIGHHDHLRKFRGIFPVSSTLYDTGLILPSYPELSKSEILHITNALKNFL